jgi:hypothetical protein
MGIPFYTATASTRRVNLTGVLDWTNPVPLDPSWTPNTGPDHKLNVFDPATSSVYELISYDPANLSVLWGVKYNYATELGDGYPALGWTNWGPTGAGVSQAAGVLRLDDIRSGSIEHALAFLTSQPRATLFRYPAGKTDGSYTGDDGLMEGMRVQLDPTLDVDAIPEIGPGEKMIAKALQKYGAFCMDGGGGNNQAMGFYGEKPKDGESDPYPAAFPSPWYDWPTLPHIPRDRLHVLAEGETVRPQ